MQNGLKNPESFFWLVALVVKTTQLLLETLVVLKLGLEGLQKLSSLRKVVGLLYYVMGFADDLSELFVCFPVGHL